MESTPVIIWQSWVEKDQVWQHNHYEETWDSFDRDNPEPISPDFIAQKGWSKQSWRKFKGYLTGGVLTAA